MKGNIFNIQHFCLQDGPGIRTVVFLKGCPLNCAWCHNPESKKLYPQILFDTNKCMGCRKCSEICPSNLHTFENGEHQFSMNYKCSDCFICTKECPTNALERCGKEISSDDVIKNIISDKEFYNNSNGGITLSGGEPLMQYDFSLDILRKCKKNNINTAIETCGFCDKDLLLINKYTDLWLYDIKLFSQKEHIKYTGVSNDLIMKNLYTLNDIGAKIILRCPIIPEINLNEEHFENLERLVKSLKNVIALNLEPYHPLGISKVSLLNETQFYNNNSFLSADVLQPYAERLKKNLKIEIEIL